MLGYKLEDIDNMIDAIESALTTVNSDDDPWLHGSLYKAKDFFEGLLAEGHFE